MSEKKKRLRVVMIRKMKNLLVGVVLGSKLDPGYRVVRVLHIRYDRQLKEVVELRVRTFNPCGREDKTAYGGFMGRIYRLTDRRHFINGKGQSCRGVLRRDGATIHLDKLAADVRGGRTDLSEFKRMTKENKPEDPKTEPKQAQPAKPVKTEGKAEQPKGKKPASAKAMAAKPPAEAPTEGSGPADAPESQPEQTAISIAGIAKSAETVEFAEDTEGELQVAEVYDPAAKLPPLKAIQCELQDPSQVKALAELLAAEPKLLVSAAALDEPRWTLACPGGAVLTLAGYGRRQPGRPKPIVAEVIEAYAFTDTKGKTTVGDDMPEDLVDAAVEALLEAHGRTTTIEQEADDEIQAEAEAQAETAYDDDDDNDDDDDDAPGAPTSPAGSLLPPVVLDEDDLDSFGE